MQEVQVYHQDLNKSTSNRTIPVSRRFIILIMIERIKKYAKTLSIQFLISNEYNIRTSTCKS